MLIDRFINRWIQWERRFMPSYVWQAEPLTFWRERILFTMCFIAVFLGPLALIPSVWLAYTEGLINVVVLDLAAYGSVFFIFFGRRLSLKVRAWMACLLLYALGVGLLFLLGHIGAGYMWLFGASVMIAAILGFWAAISSLVLNGLTFVAVACFAVYGTPEWAQPVENVLQKWIVMGGNFLLLNVLVTLTVGFMLEGLQKTLQKEQDTSSRLMQSENQYRLLAENATDTIWILNLSTLTFEYFSPSIERIRGYTPAEAQVLSLEQHLSSESYQKAIDILNEELSIDNEEGIDKNRSRTIEIKQSIKGGGYVWAEAIVSFVRDNDGKPTAVMGVTRDIEARKKAEAVLIESEKKYRNLFENGSDLLCIHDLDGNLIETNLHFKKEYGWTQQDLSDINIRDIIPPRYQQKFDRYMENILTHGSDEGYMVGQTKSGEDVVLEYRNNLIKDSSGEPKAVQGAARDVTKRFKAEKALRESEEKYKGLVRHAPAGFYEFDLEKLRFISVNDVMCEYSGYSERDFLKLDPLEILAEESKDVFTGLIENVFSNKPRELTTEYKVKGKNQKEFWVLSNTRFFYENGRPKRAMSVVHDLTDIRRAEQERRKLEIQLQNARKLESLGTLAGGVAHDLNNILSGIVSYPDLLLLDLEKDSPLYAPLKAIQRSGERAAEIVQDLLTLARRGVDSRKVVSLNQIVDDFLISPEYEKILSARGRARISVKTSLEEDALNIVGSEVHISKTLMNLMANAADAMPAGGAVTIATESCYLDNTYIGFESIPEGEYTTLKIIDNGIGMPKSDLERIFEPFYTKKEMKRSGTGLGMSVVWGTVKDHGGFIDVMTKEGSGTTFTLYFPVTREDRKNLESIHIEDYLGQGESILVIDDSEEQRELVRNMMQRLGYDVFTVASGEEAVLLVKKKQYDLMILDMIMPPGMDGLETYKQILEIVPDQKAVIASGYAKSERVYEMQQIGAGSYIKKPFTLEKIGLVVRSELIEKNGGD